MKSGPLSACFLLHVRERLGEIVYRGAAGDASSAVHEHLAALLQALLYERYARWEVADEHR